ncbi:uncharacterized protein LOC120688919 [Panicum virgatum]|uniref:uncharacterized protein LOC120688919 n=1 Tax=Panicum virgatum TaxID=38727 RepID=UPI0019D5F78C|nr:uncharacterized protein LOC120688919 [Panicum virgatum]
MAQTWYYALEQDEGMPSWERFKELANQRFGTAIRSNRLSELARLPWHGTVQDFQERFNAMVCHTPELSPKQKADLFCQRLFYPEVANYTSDGEDKAAAGGAGAQSAEDLDPVVSLNTIADIRTEDTMMVPVHIGGHRLTALLDSGSTHNFIHTDLMSRLSLVTSSAKL